MAEELRRAAACLARDRRVLAVYGFGSRVDDTARAASDVDVAVLLEESLDLAEELRLRATVVEELRRDDIDLVVLNLATPLLRYEVLARGTRLYCRDEERVDRFEERVLREYLDTAHLRATQEALAR